MQILLQEAREIQEFLEVATSDDPNELSARVSDINTYMARSGEMLAQAKRFQDQAMAAIYAEHSNLVLKMPATIATRFISSQCQDENYLVNLLDRINRTCVHQGDNLRTQISFAKEQMSLTRKGY